MKKILLISALILSLSTGVSAQKKPDDVKLGGLNKNTNNLILGIFNPNNFSMKHSLNFSMVSSKYGNISIASYTNSLNYKINDKLNVRADITMQYSPFASSQFGSSYSQMLRDDLNGISLSRLDVDYKVADNAFIRVQFRNMNSYQMDDYYYNPFYNRYDD
ncbi:MAG TPA: hypothetical protein VHP32_00340 [Ignavibacteria bacterium]|nr:hypothetical protein [Ignavibacteria bacterium]